jgi:hypothetical protein
MNAATATTSYDGVTLRQAALVAGFTYLLNPVTYAEYVYPHRFGEREPQLLR